MLNNAAYKSKHKLLADERFLMTENNFIECIDSFKPKNCDGFERIPVQIFYDAN
jgi:hypothetical protein